MSKQYDSTVEMLVDLKKSKKQAKAKGFNKKKGRRQDLKRFLKEKTIKKANKEEYVNDLIANFDGFEKEIRRAYSKGKSKVFEDRGDVVDLLTMPKFCKYMTKAFKIMQEEEHDLEIPYGLLFAIGDMYVSGDEAFADEDISSKYMKIFNSFYNKKIKKLAKKLDIEKTYALALYLISISYKDASYKALNKRVYTFLKHLYAIDDLDEKKAKLTIKSCYGKRLHYFISTALTEAPKNNTPSFAIVTNAILEIMDSMDKDELKDILKKYAKQRRQDPKKPRRIDFTKIDEEDYKNIHKVIGRLIKTGFPHEAFK